MKKKSTSSSKLKRNPSVSRNRSISSRSSESIETKNDQPCDEDLLRSFPVFHSSVQLTNSSTNQSETYINSLLPKTDAGGSVDLDETDTLRLQLQNGERSSKTDSPKTNYSECLSSLASSPITKIEQNTPFSANTPPAALSSVNREDDDLPSTQILDNRVLKNVIAYVEVRSTNDNRSEAIRKELEQLGAIVVKKFTDDVTHVIFKEGSKRTKNKAVKNKIHLVSVLWVDSCKQYQEHVSEKLYPAVLPTTSKGTPLFMAKLKKAKSMQPSNFDDEVANSTERCIKRKKHFVDKLKSSENTPQNSPNLGRILVQETQPRTPIDVNTPIRLMIPDTPPSMREKMNQLKAKDSGTPQRENEEPLQRRLFSEMQNASFDTNDGDDVMDCLKEEINKCIENMPESPIPVSSTAKSGSSPSTCERNIASPCSSVKNVNSSTDKSNKKSPKSNKRRKSVAAVKFVDDIIKPRRMSNRRKSVATFTPSKIIEEDLETNEKLSLNQSVSITNNCESGEDCPVQDLDKKNNSSNGFESHAKCQKNSSLRGRRKSSVSSKNPSKISKSQKESVAESSASNGSHTITSENTGKNCDEDSAVELSSDAVTSSINLTNISGKSVKKKEPVRTNNKKKLLPLSDLDPVLPLMSRTPDKVTTGRKRKINSAGSFDSSISALFPNKSPVQKKPRKRSHIAKSDRSDQQESSVTTTEITMTDDLTLQETTVNSSTTTQNDNSMSAVFGDSVLSSLSSRPRPSIDEFNFNRGIKHIRRPKSVSTSAQRQSDSDSSDNCQSKKTYRRSPPSRPSLVMTSLHAEEQDVVISVVKRLGHFVISDSVTESTTHLICGGPRRTLNILHGIMRGIWIVHKQWVLSSLEACTWLPEENYEITDYFPVVKVTREGKFLQKENYMALSLGEVGSIFLAQKTSPPRHHLLNLLKLCGGKVTNNLNKADIYMGHEFIPDKTCVNPVWVLDCITQQQMLDIDRYMLGRPKRESSPEF